MRLLRLVRAPNWLILVGVSSCAGGLVPNWIDPLPVSEVAEYVDVAQAVAYGQQAGLRHIELAAELDHARRIHPTALEEPAYSARCAPGGVLDLPGTADPRALEPLLGCRVRVVPSEPEPGYVVVKDGTLNQATNVFEVHHLRAFVSMPGWGSQLWVVSPDVVAQEGADESFVRSSSHVGVLTRHADLRANASDVERMVGELSSSLQENTGQPLPPDAWFVLSDRGEHVPSYRSAYIPVQGSDDALFVRVGADEEPPSGLSIDGILERSQAGEAARIRQALGTAVPEQVGILTPGGLQAYPPADHNPPAFRMGFGALCVLLGLAWHRAGRDRKLPPHEPPRRGPRQPPQPPPGQRFLKR